MRSSIASRRELLCAVANGFGAIACSALLAEQGKSEERAATLAHGGGTGPLAPRAGHFRARVKRVIFLFMHGGPSHVDTFDY